MRGTAGEYPLDYSSLYALGSGLIHLLQDHDLPPQVLIGRDTRESGEWIEKALFHGIYDQDGEPLSAGIIPTSAVSYLTLKHKFSAGIVISASHNPFQDNGIKIFSSKGIKITEEWEKYLEQAIKSASDPPLHKDVKVNLNQALVREYIEFLKSCYTADSLPQGKKIVIDCSNGASSHLAEQVFSELEAEVITINASPDGKNINLSCGSLHPEGLARKVKESVADMGIAYDGDADRVLWVDEKGRILNGDFTLFVLAGYMQQSGTLKSNTIVATSMSNMGLETALNKLQLKLHRAKVGDKYVLEQMLNLDSNLGGEQSGHTILLDDCPTGDGILTSIKMLAILVEKKCSLSSLKNGLMEFPQILVNVPVVRKVDLKTIPEIKDTIDMVEQEIGSTGRLNVRYSGTESLARIMIEGKDQAQIEHNAGRIARVIQSNIGK